MSALIAVVLGLSCVVLIASLIVLAQVRTLRREMMGFAHEWRTETIGVAKDAVEVSRLAREELSTVRDLVEEQEADLKAREAMTGSVMRAVSSPFRGVNRIRLGGKRAKEVFIARREGKL